MLPINTKCEAMTTDYPEWIKSLKAGDFVDVREHHGRGRIIYRAVVSRRSPSGRVFTLPREFQDSRETVWEPKYGSPFHKTGSGDDRRIMPPE